MSEVVLVPVGDVDRTLVEYLAAVLPDEVRSTCEVASRSLDLSGAYHPVRSQYNSTQILAKLLETPAPPSAKTLGVCDVDLFIPILTFVFGEAQLGRRAAVISVYRLRQEFYGLPPDLRLFYERCEKEAAHELGHTYGLVHCHNAGCVMHYSNSIEQVDLKEAAFCRRCSAKLQQPERPSQQTVSRNLC